MTYKSQMCSHAKTHCLHGDNCQNAHNKVELLFHPENFKSKLCLSYFASRMKCDYGDYCCFAHNEGELQIDLLHKMKQDLDFYLFHYKTVMCPYINDVSHTSDPNCENTCVYAHSENDYRRKPYLVNYSPELLDSAQDTRDLLA